MVLQMQKSKKVTIKVILQNDKCPEKGDVSILKKKEMTSPEKGKGFNEDDNELNKKLLPLMTKLPKMYSIMKL